MRRFVVEGEPTTRRSLAGILLLEPDLIDYRGHSFGYISELSKVCRDRNIPLVVVSSRLISKHLLQDLESLGATVEPRFGRISWFNRFYLSGLRFAIVGIAAVRRYPEYLSVMLNGRNLLVSAAVAIAAISRNTLIFQFMSWQNRFTDPAQIRASFISRYIVRMGFRLGVRYACETECVKHALSTYLDQPVDALPTIAPWPNVLPENITDNKSPRVGMLGVERREKNLDIFVKAVRTGVTDFQVLVQFGLAASGSMEYVHQQVLLLKRNVQDIEIIEETPDISGFNSLIMSLDIMALPYDPVVYAYSTSGNFTQALGMGVIPVVPVGTWMATQAEQEGVGVVYDDLSAAGLRQALDYAVKNRVELREHISLRSQQWRRGHSGEALLDQLLSIAALS